ncbi:MAG TPA: Na(+)/H(+) antiporter subunit B [Xanthomonadales bacterium]|nr:Na(+)/H(+) antiporter subunit B [Xanthomonadales bacterium]
MMDAFNIVLAVLVLALAVWTVVARDTFTAVVGFVAYGLLLALVWVQLHGVDIALTEAALGSGLTGALLLGAAQRLRSNERPARRERPGRLTHLAAALVAGSLTAALGIAVLALPDPAPTLAHETAASMGATGVYNPLTAVLLAFRAVDTLLEATVVLFALIGIWSVAPDAAWGGRAGSRHEVDPQGPLAFLARVLAPIGIIVGVYIFWIGADLPGGKFQGAALLAAMWLLAIFAGLADTPRTSHRALRLALVAGPVIFMVVGAAGVLIAGAFLAYPDGLAKPLIVLIEWALFPSLALTLALIVAGPPARAAE